MISRSLQLDAQTFWLASTLFCQRETEITNSFSKSEKQTTTTTKSPDSSIGWSLRPLHKHQKNANKGSRCDLNLWRPGSEKQEPGRSIDPSQNYRSPCPNEWWSCRPVSLTWQAAALKEAWSLNVNATLTLGLTIPIYHRDKKRCWRENISLYFKATIIH